MRKLVFYPKLALGNLWRNKSTYLPYLLACIVSIFTFYVMLSINANGALDGMRGETVVKSFTAVGTVILGIFCSILLFYTNSFLIKRRKKELGLYSILGMEKKNIAILLFFETFFVAVVALVLGLALGVLLSRLIFMVLLRMVRFAVTVALPVSFSSMGLTVGFFAIVFLLTLLTNLRQVRLADPVNLMAGARQGEREPKASILLTLLGIACLAAGYGIALYFRNPIDVLMMFLVAVLLVIIGTYCLFTSGSIALLKILRRNKKYYYQKNHFIAVSGMLYRMKQNAAGLATICILSCMVLVTVSSTVTLNVGAEESFLVQYPMEYRLSFDDPADGDNLRTAAEGAAKETGASFSEFNDYRAFETLVAEKNGVLVSATQKDIETIDNMTGFTYIQFIPLEDYNASTGRDVTLAPGEALMLDRSNTPQSDTLTVDGVTYRVTPIDSFAGEQSGMEDIGRTLLLVVPSWADVEAAWAAVPADAKNVPTEESWYHRIISFNLAGEEGQKVAFQQAYDGYVNSTTTNRHFQYISREDGRADWYATNGGFLFLGLYFGILFLLAAVLIIYYKQISEGYDDAERFDIMQKVGMSEYEVRKAINGQILTVFFLPLAVAILHIVVAFFPVSRAMVLFSVLNLPLMLVSTLLTVLAYALVYTIVYRRTAKTYFRIVRRQNTTA